MNGAARLFFAAAAVLLRALAWLPFHITGRCLQLARLCEQRARPPQERKSC